MTRFLVATDSVHTTAAACDYLQPRLDADDVVRVVGITGDGSRDGHESPSDSLGDRNAARSADAGDAVNVASARLATPSVETAIRDGEPADEIREELERGDVDVLVIGAHEPGPGAEEGLGRTAGALVGHVEVPTVVLPPVGLE
ncbi:hypotheical protein [Halarchaeum acidiphilum MH1-52-1]|uniref:Hypotheical protein n=1 Tax=Halarchaeum acidiphilum MH1-52-1 TaxID=1261545 RepID=U2YHG2_9EURY|nr:universal stress protein [Halarchaeum acidiphilum]GAD53936.1 hypotheical protein [Halarchaeum acidiphilum MH1-52-1]